LAVVVGFAGVLRTIFTAFSTLFIAGPSSLICSIEASDASRIFFALNRAGITENNVAD